MTVEHAEAVLVGRDLHEALGVLGELGFRIDTVWPADDPAAALLTGHGIRLRVLRGPTPSGKLRLVGPAAATRLASGITIEIAPPDPDPPPIPDLVPSFVVTRDDADAWKLGRAGMEYRDLVPDRQGGRFIASHIRIREGGPVADWVHFHAIRFQMIYCHRGWVRLVYEDQGEPFVMKAGECVLQPPRIRHRVLESSPGLEVVEIGCPALHPTHADHALALPTSVVKPERDFGGQRFVWDRTLDAPSAEASAIARATAGLAGARIARTAEGARAHDGELLFGFVVGGEVVLDRGGTRTALRPADAFVVPPGERFDVDPGAEGRWLEVTVARAGVG